MYERIREFVQFPRELVLNDTQVEWNVPDEKNPAQFGNFVEILAGYVSANFVVRVFDKKV